MAKFTAAVPIDLLLPSLQIQAAAGETARIPDAMVQDFATSIAPNIPGFAWVTQDETTAIPVLPIAESDVSGLVSDLAGKYPTTGGTISGAVTATGALIAQTSISTPLLTATTAKVTGKASIDGGFTNPYDTLLWISGAIRSVPATLHQGIYCQARLGGDLGAGVHGSISAELRLYSVTNTTYLTGLGAEVNIFDAGNDINHLWNVTSGINLSGSTAAGTVADYHAFHATTVPALPAGLTVTNIYGMYIDAQTVGTNNWGLYVNGPKSRLAAVETSGDMTVGLGTSGATLIVNGAAGNNRDLRFNTNGSLRWILRADTAAEAGSAAGSNLSLLARDDSGNAVATVFTVTRSTGGWGFGTGPLGFFGTTPVAKKTGWGAATGTATRTTFATSTVTTAQLAEHVKALIDDLLAYGLISA